MIYRIAALVVLLFLPATALAWTQKPPLPVAECSAQVPWGMPSVKPSMPVICRHAYILEHDNTAKIPVWVAYTLTPANAIGCIPRSICSRRQSCRSRACRAR